MQTMSKIQDASKSAVSSKSLVKVEEKQFDFLEAFKNMYVPATINGNHQYQVPYDELVKCLESLSYKVVTTREEYEKRRACYGSVVDAWCPLSHRIVEVKLSRLLTRHSTFCHDCGRIKSSQTTNFNKAKKAAAKINNTMVPLKPAPEKDFDFIEGFKNCFIPTLLGDSLKQTPYEDAVRCLESLSYEVITTKAEYEQRERASILRAWCPMRHCIVEIQLSVLIKEQKTHCDECGKIKRKQTNLLRYNVENVSQNEEIREKQKRRMEEIYGVTYSFQSAELRAKSRETSMITYGVDHPMKTEEVKAKLRNTFQENYGVDHPMHDVDIFKKQQEACYQFHEYVLPSGEIIHYQGYEYFCLDELLEKENIKEYDIVTPHFKNDKLPKIWYWDDETEKHRRYYPDFYIPSLNKIIEVKSMYTYSDKRFFKINQLKAQACKKAGYNFEFRIYNGKGVLESLIVV